MNVVLASVLTIGFWVLAACAVVTLMMWIFTQIQYYKWDKEDRQIEKMNQLIEQVVKTNSENIENSVDKS